MAFAGIAPPDPFLPTPGRPVQPWSRWHDMFKVYLLASGASEFSPERRKAILLHSLGPEGQRIFNTLSVSQAAEKTDEEERTGATPDVYDSAVLKRFHDPTDAFRKPTRVPTSGRRPKGQLRTPALGDDQRVEDENHKTAVVGDCMAAETETVEEDVENADCATDVQNVCCEAAPPQDDKECGVQRRRAERERLGVHVAEEIIEDEAGSCQDGEEEADESRLCEERVGESHRGYEETGD
ncbi:hypothetical protein MTO96_012510 [Rhipicephalus appendiculatus]